MAVTTEQLAKVDDKVNSLTKEVGELQGAYRHLATKEDVSNSTLNTVRWIVGVGAAILAAQFGAWLHILSRLPG